MLGQLVLVMCAIFALNLLPAFGPPTSAVLVVFSLNLDLPAPALIACGAIAAAAGRFTLGNGARRLRPRLSDERKRHLAAAQDALVRNRARSYAGLGLFALSPVPSGQLFTAAGLMTVALAPLTLAFFAGRLVSYTIYVTGAAAVESTLGDEITGSLTSPLGVALQLLALAGLALLVRINWADVLAGRGEAAGASTSDRHGDRQVDGDREQVLGDRREGT
jgi:membrane protein YqaA with SNARE-associated domain